mmetsp:Transcript_45512/g.75608  ORF Transcript_45512/g.75608 Transcript_45512/m.75608 type:complete len:289 (-) Transcript_45512:216-1082(-)
MSNACVTAVPSLCVEQYRRKKRSYTHNAPNTVRHAIQFLGRKVKDLQAQLNCERCLQEILQEKNNILNCRLKENSYQYDIMKTQYIHLEQNVKMQSQQSKLNKKHDRDGTSLIRTENEKLKARLEQAQQTIAERNAQIDQLHQELIDLKNETIQKKEQMMVEKKKETDEWKSKCENLKEEYRTLMNEQQSLRRCYEDRGPYLASPRQTPFVHRLHTYTTSVSENRNNLQLSMPSLLLESSSADDDGSAAYYDDDDAWLGDEEYFKEFIGAIVEDPESVDAIKLLGSVE